jgi:CRP-like cAMP-binding protein
MEIQLETALLSRIDFTSKELSTIKDRFQYFRLKKREVLSLRKNKREYIYFIEKGLIRYFQDADGEEVTGQFFFEGGWYTDFDSYLTGYPSKQTVQAIEDSSLMFISKKDVDELYNEMPKFERFGRLLGEQTHLGIRKKIDQLTLFSAEERYLDLLRNRPKVIKRVPQHYIASYLGIKPQSLSRIRKRISK